MHPTIKAAINRANEIAKEVGARGTDLEAERAELMKLNKKELAELIIKLKYPKLDSNRGLIQNAVYAILADPACVWLDFGIIASIIRNAYPWAETKETSVSWYSSKALEKERDVLPRKSQKEIARLLLENL